MLSLVFHLDDERLALAVSEVVEVVPQVDRLVLPNTPAWCVGIFRYRGLVTPVIDLHRLTRGTPCPDRLSTRIIVVRYPVAGGEHYLGLLAERVTELTVLPTDRPTYSGFVHPDEPNLGSILNDDQGMVRKLEVKHLLSASARDHLFAVAGSTRPLADRGGDPP